MVEHTQTLLSEGGRLGLFASLRVTMTKISPFWFSFLEKRRVTIAVITSFTVTLSEANGLRNEELKK